MVFEDISNYRKSEAWKYFWLDRSKEQAKCMKCLEEKNITKIFKVNNGNTKTLLDHLKRAHTEEDEMSIQAKKNFFKQKESMGEVISKLAIDGISFRIISESEVLQKAFQVITILYLKNWSDSIL